MTDNIQAELRAMFREHIDVVGDGWWHPKTSDTEFIKTIIDWHNKQNEAVLDRLERESFAAADEQIDVVPLSAVEAERDKLRESYNGE